MGMVSIFSRLHYWSNICKWKGINNMELNVLIIDKDKNTYVMDLMKEKELHNEFSKVIDYKKIKKHKTLKELDDEVRAYLKLIKQKERDDE
jgi:hypothetical protein